MNRSAATWEVIGLSRQRPVVSYRWPRAFVVQGTFP